MVAPSLPPIVSPELVAQYDADGVVCVRGVVGPDWIGRLQQAVDDVLAHPGRHGADIQPKGTAGRFAYDNYLWTFHDTFRRMAFEGPLGQIASAFMRSERVNLVYDFILVKEPHTPAVTKWHQDLPANPCEGSQLLGMWVSLDHATKASGAVEWARGSHRWGKRFEAATTADPEHHGFLAGNRSSAPSADSISVPIPDVDSDRARYDLISFDTAPGDVVVASMLLLHGAPGNATPHRRRAVGYRFAGDDATYAVRSTPRAIQPIRDPELANGAPFPARADHPVFPLIWPR